MNTKPFILTNLTPALHEVFQPLLFARGYRWIGTQKTVSDTAEKSFTAEPSGALYLSCGSDYHPTFSAPTDLGALLEYLDAPKVRRREVPEIIGASKVRWDYGILRFEYDNPSVAITPDGLTSIVRCRWGVTMEEVMEHLRVRLESMSMVKTLHWSKEADTLLSRFDVAKEAK